LIDANRQQIRADKGFRLVMPHDGRIQLQGDNSMWVCAEWEMSTLVQMGRGKVMPKEPEGSFASAAP
jgi:hypothetical protein